MEKWTKKWKIELQAIGISLIVTVVFWIVSFLYLLSINGPYNEWVDPSPLFRVCLISVFLFGVLSLIVLLMLYRRNYKKNKVH